MSLNTAYISPGNTLQVSDETLILPVKSTFWSSVEGYMLEGEGNMSRVQKNINNKWIIK